MEIIFLLDEAGLIFFYCNSKIRPNKPKKKKFPVACAYCILITKFGPSFFFFFFFNDMCIHKPFCRAYSVLYQDGTLLQWRGGLV